MENNINSISVVILVGGMGSRFSSINEPPKQLSKLNKNEMIKTKFFKIFKDIYKNYIFI